MRVSLKLKITATFLFLIFILFSTVGFFVYVDFQKTLEKNVDQKLDAIATIQKKRVVSVMENYHDQLTLFSNKLQLRLELSNYEKTQSLQSQEKMQAILLETKSSLKSFKDIHILTLDGTVVASTNPHMLKTNHSTDAFFLKGKQKNDASVFFKDAQKHVDIYVTGPLVLNNTVIGVVAIESDTIALFGLFHDYTGLGKSGDVGLSERLDELSGEVIVPSKFDTNPDSPLNKTFSLHGLLPAAQALRGKEQIFTDTLDFRGKKVLSATRYIPDLQWGIVVKIDEDEAYAPLSELFSQLFYGVGLIVLFVLFLATFLAQTITAPLRSLEKALGKFQSGDFSARVTVTTRDEIERIASAFNAMAERVEDYNARMKKEIEEKTQMNEELLKTNAKDEAILENIGEGLIVMDKKGNIILLNKMAQDIIDVSDSEIIGKSVFDAIRFEHENGEHVGKKDRPMTKAFATGKITINDKTCYVLRKDGRKIPVAITASPILYQGKIIGAIDVVRDITHERDIEKAKDEFLSIAAHQLRTPLGVIRWSIERILSGKLGKSPVRVSSALRDINQSNLALISLVNDLLDVSRINQGRVEEKPVATDITLLMQAVCEEMRSQLQKKSLTLTIPKGIKIPKMTVDPKLFSQVIQNLLSNAIKYNGEKGTIILAVQKKEKYVEISMKDTGIGIPKGDREKVFEKFHRADNAVKSAEEGAGLGLFVVKSYIERWHGTVRIESELGKGTTVYIQLPIR